LKDGEVEELEAKIWPDAREGSYKVLFLVSKVCSGLIS
jgi:hypothetical protein